MRVYRSIEDARQIAKYDSGGAYRPLKGAPNLPRGWLIELSNIDDAEKSARRSFIQEPLLPGWLTRPEQCTRSVYDKLCIDRAECIESPDI